MSKKKEQTGIRNGKLFCFNCGTSYDMNLPQPISMTIAMMKQFSKDHRNCQKTWTEPVVNNEQSEMQRANWITRTIQTTSSDATNSEK